MAPLGVIGGMGVHTTARFYTMLTDMQAVSFEQEYMDVLIYSKPSIPDRTGFITGKSNENPLASLLDAAKILVSAGAGCIVMPCVTAHFFYEALARTVPVPFINMMDETAEYVHECGYPKIGLLATDGTLQGRLFHKAFAKFGIDVVLPDTKAQEFLGEAIYQLKRGKMPGNTLGDLSAGLHDLGAEAIVLGCTELGLLQRCNEHIYIEAMEVLAKAALIRMKD
ncbi:MAG: amino acid racemase [Defluviitaleaceae bacterium]|nr:amino acid racemase [Defluviitaleaceae bacterium]